MDDQYLEFVVNISEGRDTSILHAIRDAASPSLLDWHADEFHNRSVFTMLGRVDRLGLCGAFAPVVALCETALHLVDLSKHSGVHPRFGAIDVLPIVAIVRHPNGIFTNDSNQLSALSTRYQLAEMLRRHNVGHFFYGHDAEPTLPELRKTAFTELQPEWAPSRANDASGVTAMGVRSLLLAWNVDLVKTTLTDANEIAKSLRGPGVRSLAFPVGAHSQVSFNLVDPLHVGPDAIYDAIAGVAAIQRAELVGLAPEAMLRDIPEERWSLLDLSLDRTIESRAAQLGL